VAGAISGGNDSGRSLGQEKKIRQRKWVGVDKSRDKEIKFGQGKNPKNDFGLRRSVASIRGTKHLTEKKGKLKPRVKDRWKDEHS